MYEELFRLLWGKMPGDIPLNQRRSNRPSTSKYANTKVKNTAIPAKEADEGKDSTENNCAYQKPNQEIIAEIDNLASKLEMSVKTPASENTKGEVNNANSKSNQKQHTGDDKLTSNNPVGSRFVELNQMCIVCDEPCIIKENDVKNPNAQCAGCEIWIHKECTKIEKQELDEQILLGAFHCTECLNLGSQQTNAESSVEDLDSMETDEDTMNSQEALQAEFDLSLNENKDKSKEISHGMETDDYDDTMNTQDVFQAEFDSRLKENEDNLEEIGQAGSLNEFGAGAKCSSPKEGDSQMLKENSAKNQNIETKIDKMLNMMNGLKEEVSRVKTDIKKSDTERKKFMKYTPIQIRTNVQRTVNQVFARRENREKENTDRHIKKKIEECMTEELDKNLDWKLDEKVNEVEISIGQRLKKLEKNVDQDLERTIEAKLQNKIEDRLKKWKRKMRMTLTKNLIER